MKKKGYDSASSSAKEYMQTYRGKIKTKHEELEKQKTALLENLEQGSAQYETMEKEFREKMRTYVEELKALPEHADQYKRYQKDMQKVREFFKMMFLDQNLMTKETARNDFEASKEYFYGIDDSYNRKQSQKIMKKYVSTLTSQQKTQVMEKIEHLAKDPSLLADEFQKITDEYTNPKLLEVVKKMFKKIENIGFAAALGYVIMLSIMTYTGGGHYPKESSLFFASFVPIFLSMFGIEYYKEKTSLKEGKKYEIFMQM